MARPRRMPPLFEVMKEPLKRIQPDGSSPPPSPHAPAHADAPVDHPGRDEHDSVPNGIGMGSGSLGGNGTSHGSSARSAGLGHSAGSSPSATVVFPEIGRKGEGAGRQLVLTTPRLMIALAVVLGGVIVLWSLAYKLGESSERSKFSPYQDQEATGTGDAGSASETAGAGGTAGVGAAHNTSAGRTGRTGGTGKTGGTTTPTGGGSTPKPVPGGGSGGTKTGGTTAGGTNPGGTGSGGGGATPSGGGVAAGLTLDPRQPGLNYLIMAALTASDAQEAIAYLKTQGIDALAFPDRSIDASKPDAADRLKKAAADNEKFWVIYAKGFPGGSRYSESETERNAIRTKIERAGRTWQRDHKGATDFAATYWQLYKGS